MTQNTSTPTTSQVREGEIYFQGAEQALLQWIEQNRGQNLAGRYAYYLEAPPKVTKLPAWQEPRLATIAYQQLITHTAFAKPPTVFLFGDYSLVILLDESFEDKVNDLRQSVDSALLEGVNSRGWRAFSLEGQLADLATLTEHKTKHENAAENTQKILDESMLKNSLVQERFKKRPKHSPLEILVVEDDAASGKLLAHLLKQYNVHIARTAQDAVKHYAIQVPDIVLLDIGLPDFSGLKLLEVLRTHDSQAFVVMLSANSSRENLQDAVSKGAKGFVAKPFTQQKLHYYISQLTGK